MSDIEISSHRDLPTERSKRGSKKCSIVNIEKYIRALEKIELFQWRSRDIATHLKLFQNYSKDYEHLQDQIIGILQQDDKNGRFNEEEKEYDQQINGQSKLRLKLNGLLAASQA